MSRIGRKIINLPEKVSVEVNGSVVVIKGPKGELSRNLPPEIKITKDGHALRLELIVSSPKAEACWGTFGSLVAGMVEGVTKGYEKKLEIEGVGFKAQLRGPVLVLNLGFSHPIEFHPPKEVSLKLEKNTIVVSGIDKALVGETAANIRRLKKPEPYKGKGIHYLGEVIKRKSGKKATSTSVSA